MDIQLRWRNTVEMKIWVTLFISDFVIVVAANHTFGTYSR